MAKLRGHPENQMMLVENKIEAKTKWCLSKTRPWLKTVCRTPSSGGSLSQVHLSVGRGTGHSQRNLTLVHRNSSAFPW